MENSNRTEVHIWPYRRLVSRLLLASQCCNAIAETKLVIGQYKPTRTEGRAGNKLTQR